MVIRSRIVFPAAQFCVAGITTWALMAWMGGRQHLLYVWPLTAMQLAIVLVRWRDPVERYAQIVSAACGELIACLFLSIPLWISLSFSVGQAAEVWLAGAILARSITCFDDLKHRSQVMRFAIVALAVPSLSLAASAVPVGALTHVQPWLVWLTVMPSDALGYAVVFPALFFLLSGEYRFFRKLRPHLIKSAPSLLCFIAVSIAIFAQNTNPFLFLIFPPLILVVFALGLEGAVFALPILTIVACAATARGRGPIWLNPALDTPQRILVLQTFLCSVAAVALAIGALLDERRRAGRAAEEAQSIYRTLLANAEDMIILSSLDGSRRFASPAVRKLTGWTPEEFIALRHFESIHPADRDLARTVLASLAGGKLDHTFRYRMSCKDGSYRWVEAYVRGYRESGSGSATGYVATVHDISAWKETEESWMAERAVLAQENQHLANLATLDELTGIPNRRSFNMVLENEAARHARSEKPLALLMIDVDWFKKYNDLYGHPAGDECLRRLAQALKSTAGRAADFVARLGGEEFAALLPGTNQEGAHLVAEHMLHAVHDLDIEHADSPLGRVSVSIGISLWPSSYTTETAYLIQQADRALYECKRQGRNSIIVWEEHVSAASPGTFWNI